METETRPPEHGAPDGVEERLRAFLAGFEQTCQATDRRKAVFTLVSTLALVPTLALTPWFAWWQALPAAAWYFIALAGILGPDAGKLRREVARQVTAFRDRFPDNARRREAEALLAAMVFPGRRQCALAEAILAGRNPVDDRARDFAAAYTARSERSFGVSFLVLMVAAPVLFPGLWLLAGVPWWQSLLSGIGLFIVVINLITSLNARAARKTARAFNGAFPDGDPRRQAAIRALSRFRGGAPVIKALIGDDDRTRIARNQVHYGTAPAEPPPGTGAITADGADRILVRCDAPELLKKVLHGYSRAAGSRNKRHTHVRVGGPDGGLCTVQFDPTPGADVFCSLVLNLDHAPGIPGMRGAVGLLAVPGNGRWVLTAEYDNTNRDTLLGRAADGRRIRVHLPDGAASKTDRELAVPADPAPAVETAAAAESFDLDLPVSPPDGNPELAVTRERDYNWNLVHA